MKARPFKTVEELLFNDNIIYSKFNKRALDALTRSDALRCLMDDRFTGMKHFWSAVVVDRPKTLKKLKENIELYKPEGDFSDEEKIEHITQLTGAYPINLVMTDDVMEKLLNKNITPIGKRSDEDGDVEYGNRLVWFIPRSMEAKTTKTGKTYWIVTVTDSTNTLTTVKCWGIKYNDVLHNNRPYLAQVQYDSFGYSIRSFKDGIKLLA